MKLTELLRNRMNLRVFSLQIVQIVRTGSVFLVSVFLANIYKDTFIISQYETLSLVGTGLTFFWVSGLMTTFLPFYYNQPGKEKPIIFNTFISLNLISLLSSLLIILTGMIFFKSMSLPLFIVFAIYIFFNSPAFLTEYFYLVKERKTELIVYAIAAFSLQTIAFCLPLFLGASLLSALVFLAGFTFLRFVFLVYLLRHYLSFKEFDREIFLLHLKRSSPIMLSLLVGGSTEIVNGFIVRKFASSHDFALFRYGAREFPITRLLANSLSIVLSGEISAALIKNQLTPVLDDLKKGSLRLMHFLFPLTVILLIVSPFLYKLLYTDVFYDSYKIFNVYLLLTVSRLIFPQTILMGMQKNNRILEASVVEFILNLTLGIVLINLFGIYGIPFATLAAYYVNQLLLMIVVTRNGIKISSYVPWQWLLFYTVISWVVFIIML
ncbi:MAG TPA: polysaccharide biosynthesis C-terminal domain-containing protein [Bacteroidia bacterium]|nr:polysaccharide biosynthesis C-terminal domain-containing protein [Bacteroidia bacterium]HRS58524.1 polysaccharide biosynthesis C-terminal domain-containing protein [Bacteroidia bacterium]HRU69044.1 polysaccharide biosynthesis C-terminal domain-containing protein [Bacteroidia bacterium]